MDKVFQTASTVTREEFIETLEDSSFNWLFSEQACRQKFFDYVHRKQEREVEKQRIDEGADPDKFKPWLVRFNNYLWFYHEHNFEF